MKKIFLLISLMGLTDASWAQGPGSGPLRAVDGLDVARYMGTWYEIARLPNRFQKDCAGNVTATYSLREDGDIDVVNRCRRWNGEVSEAEGRAIRADDEEPTSKLKVRFSPAFLSFLPFVWGDYWVIDLAPDYSHAVIGEPDREYFWILSRTPALDEDVFQAILDRARGQGYDLSGLIRTAQSE